MYSRKQRLVFLKYINNRLNDPHLFLYLREELKGEDITFKRYYDNVKDMPADRDEAIKVLYWYLVSQGLDNQYFQNVLKDTEHMNFKLSDVETLNEHLRLLNLPTLGDSSIHK